MHNQRRKVGRVLGSFFALAMIIVAGAGSGWCDEAVQCNEARPPTADAAVKSPGRRAMTDGCRGKSGIRGRILLAANA